MPVDIRVWRPDETCLPCNFEAAIGAGDLFFGRFTVPNRHTCVITYLYTSGATAVKSTTRIVIARGTGDPADRTRDIQFNGGLMDCAEVDGTGVTTLGGNRAVGFVAGNVPRTCRLILEAGTYEVYKVGAVLLAICFTGYVFPSTRT